MNELKFSFFNRIANSVLNFSFYKHAFKERTGRAVLYLLLLTLFLGVIITIRPLIEFNKNITLFINAFEQKVPDFHLENGELDVYGEMPITIEMGGTLLIIDTSGKTNESVLDQYPGGIFVSRHKMIQKNLLSIREIDFRQFERFTLDKSDISRGLPYMHMTSVLFGILVLVGFVLFRFFTAFFVSFIGMVLGSSAGLRLTFSDAFRISAYALTLPLLITAVVKSAGVYVPFFFVIYIMIAVFYFWKAVTLIKDDSFPKLTV